MRYEKTNCYNKQLYNQRVFWTRLLDFILELFTIRLQRRKRHTLICLIYWLRCYYKTYRAKKDSEKKRDFKRKESYLITLEALWIRKIKLWIKLKMDLGVKIWLFKYNCFGSKKRFYFKFILNLKRYLFPAFHKISDDGYFKSKMI